VPDLTSRKVLEWRRRRAGRRLTGPVPPGKRPTSIIGGRVDACRDAGRKRTTAGRGGKRRHDGHHAIDKAGLQTCATTSATSASRARGKYSTPGRNRTSYTGLLPVKATA
jgi:hypothetical protein